MGVLDSGIDVRALVAVDFDGHEVLVEQRCNVGFSITLAVHDVTPMTPDAPMSSQMSADRARCQRERLGPIAATPRVSAPRNADRGLGAVARSFGVREAW